MLLKKVSKDQFELDEGDLFEILNNKSVNNLKTSIFLKVYPVK